jgi:predicted RNA-binding protein associated with RNAse of E/G family
MSITKSQFVTDSYEIEPLNPLTKKQAELKIRGIASELYLFGNNEKEIAEIDDIVRRLHSGQITPDRAVVEAKEILEVKNSYANLYKSFFNMFNIF